MFVNCPACRGLVATDPATDLPPERCPRCAAPLREAPSAQPPANDARSGVAAAVAEAFGHLEASGASDPADDLAAQPAISMATLLQPGSESGPSEASGPEPGPDQATLSSQAPATAPVPALAPAPPPAAEPDEPAPPAASAPATEPAPAATPPAAASRPRRATPSFARMPRDSARAKPAGRRWPIPAAIAGLALLLAIQWLLADRERLAADATWRPVVAGACAVLRCSLPPWREPTAFALLERDVRPHPQAGNALRITASFRNDAAWAQAWPDVVLTLSDIDGRPLGARAFTPTEYLGNEPPSALIDSGEGAVIRMDVLEPDAGAVGFSFDFR
ncbi:DUF3426 domain-containing protein [Luteimonas arsenica]|uniref:DUF3426 domain-containing protein n=1 Tax=Luteimonas arsenica TaxID=1586242 RepID=UPI0010555756|nr:DUF3426 domain-containing protein [Luteimonas arsenica]